MNVVREPSSGAVGACLVLLAIISIVRVALTYSEISGAVDEPFHIAAGMEWLQHHRNRGEALHTPLGRMSVAVVPYMAGHRAQGLSDELSEGNAILLHGGNYERTLMLARLGVIPFFVLGLLVVYGWTAELHGRMAGLISTAVLSVLPSPLAHAGLADTDTQMVACSILALWSFTRVLRDPMWRNGALFGVATGIAISCKLSALMYILPACVAILLWQTIIDRRLAWKALLPPAAWAIVAAFFTLWATYFFEFGTIAANDVTIGPIPMPSLIRGMQGLRAYNTAGVETILFGSQSLHGWWYYYPIVVLIKNPVPWGVAALAGVLFAITASLRMRRAAVCVPIVAALAVLAVASASSMQYSGVRHVLLAVYLLTIGIGGVAVVLLRSGGWRRLVVVMLGAWLLVSSVRSHPDYLAYFNELVPSPEQALSADMDWGNDIFRLRAKASELRIDELSVIFAGSAPVRELLRPIRVRCLRSTDRPTGWLAVSRQVLIGPAGRSNLAWLDARDAVANVGKSMVLYRIPGATERAQPAGVADSTMCGTDPWNHE